MIDDTGVNISSEQLPEGLNRCPRCRRTHAIDESRIQYSGPPIEPSARVLQSYLEEIAGAETTHLRCPHCGTTYMLTHTPSPHPGSTPLRAVPRSLMDRFAKAGHNTRGNAVGEKPALVKPHVRVGMLGHVGHGKTTLTSAITRVLAEHGLAKAMRGDEISNMSEEQIRKAMNPVACVQYQTYGRYYTHADCPSRAELVRNMFSGTTPIDCGVLTVAVDDGPMPQTEAHIAAARHANVPAMVVFLNKVDLVDDTELVDLVEMELRESLTKLNMHPKDVPIIRGSALAAVQGRDPEYGHDAVLRLLDALDRYTPPKGRDVMRFSCPQCGNPLQVPGEWAGRTGMCPGCRTTFAAPK